MDFRSLELTESNGLNEASDMGIMGMVNDGNPTDLFQPIYPLLKQDIFIIRAYKIITKESILNSNHIQESLSTSNKKRAAGENTGNNNNKGVMSVHPQYSATFNKISRIFNVLLNKGTIWEEPLSKKSPIELFHRFQQIIKEIELNFDNCPYSKFFNKINDNLFQIKDSRELRDDPYWKNLSDEILAVYNPRTGKMINQNRKKNANNSTTKAKKNTKNGNATQTNTSNTTIDNNGWGNKPSNDITDNNTQCTDLTNNNSTNNNDNNNNAHSTLEDEFINMTTDLLNSTNNTDTNQLVTDVNNPNNILSLQKKLNATLSQPNNNGTSNDTRLVNSHGYYTQPTSPGLLNNFPFTIDPNGTNNDSGMAQQENQVLNINLDTTIPNTTQISNHRKRRSLGSVNLDNLENTDMDEILKYTNINKRSKVNDGPKSNKPLPTLLDNTPNSSVSTATTTNASNQSQLNTMTSTNNTSVADDIMNKFNITDTLANARNTMLSQRMTSNMDNTIPLKQNNSVKSLEPNPLQEVRNSYTKVLEEKDKRIQSLENEISLQRQETIWLRKMLIEDMGCVRNLLKDMTNK